jgi:hypothetical protein
VRIAQDACAERGIAWREPHRAKKGWRNWRVWMPSDRRGGNAVVIVSRASGTAKVHFYAR